ncbi:hypothetical protein YC2023_048259 [Brassica napus]
MSPSRYLPVLCMCVWILRNDLSYACVSGCGEILGGDVAVKIAMLRMFQRLDVVDELPMAEEKALEGRKREKPFS